MSVATLPQYVLAGVLIVAIVVLSIFDRGDPAVQTLVLLLGAVVGALYGFGTVAHVADKTAGDTAGAISDKINGATKEAVDAAFTAHDSQGGGA